MNTQVMTIIIQNVIILCFAVLTGFSAAAKDFNMAGVNLALLLLYIFLYWRPF